MTLCKLGRTAFLVMLILVLFGPGQIWANNKGWELQQGHESIDPRKPNRGGQPDDSGPKQCGGGNYTMCPVYARTGRLEQTFTDLSVPGVGPSLSISRTYQSIEWANTLFGRRWVFNLGRRITITRGSEGDRHLLIRREMGEINSFRERADGTLERLTGYGVPYTLLKNPDGTYAISEKDGTVQHISADGKILQIIDRNGNPLSFEYSKVGCLSRITNASGNYVDFQLGPNGKIASVSDNLGRTILYTYDANGNLTSSSDPMGHTTRYAYDGEDRLERVLDPLGNTVFAVTYDDSQPPRVASFSEKGETWTFSYFKDHTVKKDSAGNAWTYYFNDLGIIEKFVDPLGNSREQHHNRVTATSMDWTQDANGNRTTYTYDAMGNVTSKTDPLGNTWQYTYIGGTSRAESGVDPLGTVTRYEYDTNGNHTKIIEAVGTLLERQMVFTYDANGSLLTSSDPVGSVTKYEYDRAGNMIKMTDAVGNVTEHGYDALGRRTFTTDPSGNTTRFSYDADGHLVDAVDPMGRKTQMVYDASGRMTRLTTPAGSVTRYLYDSNGNLIQVTDPLGQSTTYEFDCLGSRTMTRDANGNETRYAYDAAGRLVSVRNALGNTTTYGYDAAGNQTSITDARGNTTRYTYDASGRLIREVNPCGDTREYGYDRNGNLISRITPAEYPDARGADPIIYAYDRHNRLTRVDFPGGGTVVYDHDVLGNLVRWTDSRSGLSQETAYDPLRRPLRVITHYPLFSKTVAYTYNQLGDPTSMTDGEGGVTRYECDSMEQVTRIIHPDNLATTYTYDIAGRRTQKTLPNGVVTTYAYDLAGNLTRLANQLPDESTLSSYNYTYDATGNRLAMTTAEGTHYYTYDKTYQVVRATHPGQPEERYTYDPVGNRLASSEHSDWTYDACNRLLTYGSDTFSYDHSGNRTRWLQGSRATEYTWDQENRLTAVQTSAYEIRYGYDVASKRMWRSVGGKATWLLYDREDVIAEYDPAGTLLATHLHGPGVDEPLAVVTPSRTEWLVLDGLGSVTGIVDDARTLLSSQSYTSFGIPARTAGFDSPYLFTAREFESGPAIYYYRARYYDPTTGGFLAEDPVPLWADPASIGNPYYYARNDPVNRKDPSGLLDHIPCSSLCAGHRCNVNCSECPCGPAHPVPSPTPAPPQYGGQDPSDGSGFAGVPPDIWERLASELGRDYVEQNYEKLAKMMKNLQLYQCIASHECGKDRLQCLIDSIPTLASIDTSLDVANVARRHITGSCFERARSMQGRAYYVEHWRCLWQ